MKGTVCWSTVFKFFPPGVISSGDNGADPARQLSVVYPRDGAISSGKKGVVKSVLGVSHGGRAVGRLPSIVRSETKNLGNASVLS